MEAKQKNNRIVAFIPVRGGSKSIPLKNIKEIAGKPLVFWTLQAVVQCPLVERVVVATDSEEIGAKVAELHNEKVEIIGRSPETASDTASTESAMLEFAQHDQDFEIIVLIQATSPLLRTQDIERGIRKFLNGGYDSLLSVVRQKRFIWEDQGTEVKPLNYDPLARPRRQEHDGFLVENGAFYITSRTSLLNTQCRVSGKIGSYEMPGETYYELDEPSDWIVIENLLLKRGGEVFGEL